MPRECDDHNIVSATGGKLPELFFNRRGRRLLVGKQRRLAAQRIRKERM